MYPRVPLGLDFPKNGKDFIYTSRTLYKACRRLQVGKGRARGAEGPEAQLKWQGLKGMGLTTEISRDMQRAATNKKNKEAQRKKAPIAHRNTCGHRGQLGNIGLPHRIRLLQRLML